MEHPERSGPAPFRDELYRQYVSTFKGEDAPLSLEALRGEFNRESSQPRVIVLLSPT